MSQRLLVAEPPWRYQVLPPLVVDCSILAGLVFREAWRAQAAERMAGKTLHAPALLPFEMASVAAKKQTAGRADIAADGLHLFAQPGAELHPVDPARILALATQHHLSTDGAAYLWLAAALKAPLAAFDEQLAAAARAHLASLP